MFEGGRKVDAAHTQIRTATSTPKSAKQYLVIKKKMSLPLVQYGSSGVSSAIRRRGAAAAVEAAAVMCNSSGQSGLSSRLPRPRLHQRRSYATEPGHAASRSSSADAEHVFTSTFGSSLTAATTASSVDDAPHHQQVEALFAQQFDVSAAGVHHGRPLRRHYEQQQQYGAFSAAGHPTAFPIPASSFVDSTASKDKSKVTGRWGGLWRLLTGGRYAGVPTRTNAPHQHHGGVHRTRRGAAVKGGAAAAPATSVPAYNTHTGAFTAAPPAAGHVHASPPPPPPPALQRYWRSYHLWQSVHQHVQNEGNVLEGIRAQMRSLKTAQQAELRAQLRSTTRWTVFVVMPLLTVLWGYIFLDSLWYRSEVLQLRMVNYDAVLAELEAASETGRKAWRGQKGGAPNNNKSIRID
ncbi:hypothetical protein ABB37_09726 [Leptomonas pyrrhocoris]|uniref:Transmembrane protein n=1 Tax=Leptomonas pyrrhocoris TaxID=157538 RepID=A0A0N0VCR2_LEPPY|nr:hypothetical protein ABB37_09726 [Leptomonas pyrrhocoris]KPA73594.1 hypothetical protein ABB37_09726 [Leptomonas pyrrhocoris]|eukprot:XP_015652033.1 hypothetical protein ABB37_09726 [Leptomonas pyrrhocoris]